MRLLKIIGAIWLLLASLIIGAKAYGSANKKQNPLTNLGFAVCNGQPCFLGIVPGLTTEKEAYELVSKYDQTADYEQGQSIIARVNNMGFALIIDHETEEIISIQIPIYKGDDFPHLDSFIMLYGLPCSVEALKGQTRLILDFPNLEIGADVSDRLSLSADLSFVSLVSTKASSLFCAYHESPTYSSRPWFGFATLIRYLPA